jgi:hypothetical protein
MPLSNWPIGGALPLAMAFFYSEIGDLSRKPLYTPNREFSFFPQVYDAKLA